MAAEIVIAAFHYEISSLRGLIHISCVQTLSISIVYHDIQLFS
jgi:hypothetical protein